MPVIVALADNSIQLVPDGTLVIHVLIVVAMIAILNRTLFKPVNRILADREMATEGSVAEAASVVSRVKDKVRDYERRLREARAAGYQLLEQEKVQVLRDRERKVQGLRNEMGAWVAGQKAELQAQAEIARRDLNQKTQGLGFYIASRVLERPVRRETFL
ncbi:MAG TPA: hypothetical protein VJ023_01450 [Pyrinomonadaceae bacterium]|nr:hypothetical protein [Pyrinomonadaceae bacterium]